MRIENRYLIGMLIVAGIALLLGSVLNEDFNKFISHPIVSGAIIAAIASFYIPKRIEAERIKTLRKGFYEDIDYIVSRYEGLAKRFIECAKIVSIDNCSAMGPIEYGNEAVTLSRLDQQLALSRSQKEALVKIDNAVNIINSNLEINTDKIIDMLKQGRKGMHSDSNMKAATNSACYMIYMLRKMLEHKDRFECDNPSDEVYIEAALYSIYSDDRKGREIIYDWLLSKEPLPTVLSR